MNMNTNHDAYLKLPWDAWALLEETLRMDADSSFVELSLRKEIEQALSQVEELDTVGTVPQLVSAIKSAIKGIEAWGNDESGDDMITTVSNILLGALDQTRYVDIGKHRKDLITLVRDMITDDGEGLLNDEGVDVQVASAMATAIVDTVLEKSKPLTVNLFGWIGHGIEATQRTLATLQAHWSVKVVMQDNNIIVVEHPRSSDWFTLSDNGGEVNVERINHSDEMRSMPSTSNAFLLTAETMAWRIWCAMDGKEVDWSVNDIPCALPNTEPMPLGMTPLC